MMIRARRLVLASIASLLVASPALADNASPAPATKAKPRDPNEVVCQQQEETGSRLSGRRVCMTRQQWADQLALDREALQHAQRSNPDKSN